MTEEGALVARWLAGRTEADFRALYRRCTPALYGLALRLARGEEAEAREVVQEAWVRALGRLEAYAPDRPLGPWLGGFVVNCWRERTRQARPAAGREAPEEAGGGDPAERLGAGIDLQRALDGLPDGYREVLLLHDVEGYTHEEIGRLLGISPGTSKSQLSRARRALRERLPGGAPTGGARRH